MEDMKYVIDNDKLIAEWDWDKNNDLDPRLITLGSGKKVWWRCNTCGNHWLATVSNRFGRESGCPYCAGKRPIIGMTDLESQFPYIAAQWDYSKNGELKPCDVTSKSSKRVWWICDNGHSWISTVANRTSNHGCPYCAGKLAIVGETDLESQFPHVAAQWDYDKNGELLPHQVSSKSNKSVWWICEHGHSWKSTVYHRTNGHGCPTCAHHLQKSFPETAIYFYISKFYNDSVQSYKSSELGKFEFDIYIPSRHIAIEYDGKAYHNQKHSVDRESRKYQIAKLHGIFLVRIREGECISPNCDEVFFTQLGELNFNSPKYNLELARIINQVFDILGIKDKISCSDLENDQISISSLLYQYSTQNNSLGEIASEWDYEKNAPLLPKMLSLGSNQQVYWKCKNGHSWKASIKERIGRDNRKGTGCPYCSGNKVLVGYNDIASQFPALLKEWDYTRNMVLPTEISRGYNGKIWWICKNGHNWQSRISNRINLNTGCPYCSNRKVIAGDNDFSVTNPSLVKEWDYAKNEGINLHEYTAGSHKKVWWMCPSCGYEWIATIRDRAKGQGCPACANRVVFKGHNDLKTLNPSLSLEWDIENNELSPNDVVPGSHKKVWWKCSSCGHQWAASIYSRNNGSGCPECAKKSRQKQKAK